MLEVEELEAEDGLKVGRPFCESPWIARVATMNKANGRGSTLKESIAINDWRYSSKEEIVVGHTLIRIFEARYCSTPLSQESFLPTFLIQLLGAGWYLDTLLLAVFPWFPRPSN